MTDDTNPYTCKVCNDPINTERLCCAECYEIGQSVADAINPIALGDRAIETEVERLERPTANVNRT